ncbi:MAG: SocA family protein [Nitrosopumilus sp.]|nr:SocA family protein [Nitrosopumilus sp.]
MEKREPEDIGRAERMAYMFVYAPVDGSYNVPVPSDTLFQKQMFMLSRRQETGLRFTSWKYGPFSKALFDAMNINKKQENLVRIPEKKIRSGTSG